MPMFRDAVLDRIHELSKRVVEVTSPSNPMRSPSTANLVVDEIEPLFCEIELLYPLLKRTAANDRGRT